MPYGGMICASFGYRRKLLYRAVTRVRDAKGPGFAGSAKRSGARKRQRTPQQPDPDRRVGHGAAGGGTP
jgi:hypothetical protein